MYRVRTLNIFPIILPLNILKWNYVTTLIFFQKRNKELEAEVLDWISKVLGEPLPKGEFEDVLKDGIILCNLMNKLTPGSVKKIATKGTNFQLMENIQRFQAGMKAYGVPQEEIFQTADLFEKRNVAQVSVLLFFLGNGILI